jgi:hypothetical protein
VVWNVGVRGRTISEWILKSGMCTGFIWFSVGSIVSAYQHSNESLVPKKMGNFLTSCMAVEPLRRTLLHGVLHAQAI